MAARARVRQTEYARAGRVGALGPRDSSPPPCEPIFLSAGFGGSPEVGAAAEQEAVAASQSAPAFLCSKAGHLSDGEFADTFIGICDLRTKRRKECSATLLVILDSNEKMVFHKIFI